MSVSPLLPESEDKPARERIFSDGKWYTLADHKFKDSDVIDTMLKLYRPDLYNNDGPQKIPTVFKDPFCCKDFRWKTLCPALPRLAFAIFFYYFGLYLNNLSQAWLQTNMTGFYEASWGFSSSNSTQQYAWLLRNEKRVYMGRWGHELPEDVTWEPPKAFRDTYYNQTVTLYDVGFLRLPDVRQYFGFGEVNATKYAGYADMFAGGSAAFGLFRFVVLPGPMSMRWTYLSRVLVLWGVLFMFRAATIILTPLPNPYHQCVEKTSFPENNWKEALANMPGLNALFSFVERGKLEPYNELTCQDVMYSGHTAMGTIWSLFTLDYMRKSPWFPELALQSKHGWCPTWACVSRTVWELGVYFWLLHGWYSIIVSHFHYSVDVCVGIFLTFVVFRSYHSRVKEALMGMRVEQLESGGASSLYEFFLEWFEKEAPDLKLQGRLHERSVVEIADKVKEKAQRNGKPHTFS